MKKILMSSLCLLAISSEAGAADVIYKCVENGQTSYVNTALRSGSCTATDLSNPNKISTVSSNDMLKRKYAPSELTGSKVASVNINQEQFVRDSKRTLILKKELDTEKEQLKTITAMLKNVSNDPAQVSKLKEMENTHKTNIASLQKELGVNKTSGSSGAIGVARASQPDLIVVHPEKQDIKEGILPVNVLNTNADTSKIIQAGLPTYLPTTAMYSKSPVDQLEAKIEEKLQTNSLTSPVSSVTVNTITEKAVSETEIPALPTVTEKIADIKPEVVIEKTKEEIQKEQAMKVIKQYSSYLAPLAKDAKFVIDQIANQ